MTNQEFIDQIAVYVKKYAAIFGICVHSPIIAQAILESGWGKSKLAATYHNYFGLKCGTKWTGKSVNMNTQEEYEPGVLTTIADNFRVFDSMEEGVKGYFEFIQLSRYQNLKGITDPKTYLETIKADGYATSSAYVQNNMNLVEQYELTKYDNEKGDNMGDRQKPGNWLVQYKGIAEGSEQHKAILKIFNDSGLCTRYKMTVNDAWCATSVSSAFIASGLTGIFPCVECSCENMINLAINAGIWVENDAYVPDVGDVILYDWDDNGVGDCTGWSDHVGIVISCDGSTIRVIEGNKSNTVGYRDIAVNGKCIRGFITPHYAAGGSTTPQGRNISPTIYINDIIEIPGLDIRYPVMEGTTSKVLNAGIGHIEETAGIGESGNCVLCGHNGSRYGTFFTPLNQISIGDDVTIIDKNGQTHIYEVTDTEVVNPYDNSIKTQGEEKELTLFTCSQKGTMRFVVRCIYKEAVMDE